MNRKGTMNLQDLTEAELAAIEAALEQWFVYQKEDLEMAALDYDTTTELGREDMAAHVELINTIATILGLDLVEAPTPQGDPL